MSALEALGEDILELAGWAEGVLGPALEGLLEVSGCALGGGDVSFRIFWMPFRIGKQGVYQIKYIPRRTCLLCWTVVRDV